MSPSERGNSDINKGGDDEMVCRGERLVSAWLIWFKPEWEEK